MFACHHLQSSVESQVGQIVKQTACLTCLLHGDEFVLGGCCRVRQPCQGIVATRIGGSNGDELDVFAHHNLDGVFV